MRKCLRLSARHRGSSTGLSRLIFPSWAVCWSGILSSASATAACSAGANPPDASIFGVVLPNSGFYSATSVAVDPSYDFNASIGDIAVVHLAGPVTDGPTPKASDCLFILRDAVGTLACVPECMCAPAGGLPVTATDALMCLKKAVGVSGVVLDCRC